MPIRINFLAELRDAEELRRRDPVKRAIWVGALIVAGVLAWAGYLQMRIWGVNSETAGFEARFKQKEAPYKVAQEKLRQLTDVRQRLDSLQRLAESRVLWGSGLDALQHSMVGMEGIQLTQFRVSQAYTLIEGIKAQTNGTRVIPGQPARSRENILVTIDAKDASSRPGDMIRHFQEQVAEQPFFKTNLNKIGMTGRSPVQTETMGGAKPFVQFVIEARFTERER